MPKAGGSAGKYGLRYEDRWTAYSAVRILTGEASAIYLEGPDSSESGFEFSLSTDAATEYHQVKRQKAGEGGWTLKSLAQAGVLGAFHAKLQDPNTKCVFTSGHAAATLEELVDRASKFDDWEEFRRDLSGNLTWQSHFEDLRQIWDDETGEWTFSALQRVVVSTINETELKRALQLGVELYLEGPGEPAPAALIEVIRDSVNENLNASNLWHKLESKGYRPITGGAGTSDEALAQLNQRFITSRTSTLVGGRLIPREETEDLEDAFTEHRLAFVQGTAGSGKSDVILEFCKRLEGRGERFLALRLDRPVVPLTDETDLAIAFGLPGSPAALLTGPGAESGTLIIDQLDALSTTSGRRPEFMNRVAEAVGVALSNPKTHVVLASRSFDAENDARFREIANLAGEDAKKTISVGLLAPEAVESVLAEIGVDAAKLSASLVELLRLPLHLWLLQSVFARNPQATEALRSAHDLYHAYWEEKRAEVDEALGRGSEWLAVIERLVDFMSDQQQLTAPKAIVDSNIEDVKAMLSAGVLVEEGESLAFFHETFFDYAYARTFVSRTKTLPELLGADQFLFRRAQVRQILEYSRRNASSLYRTNLRYLLDDANVRFHIKDMVIAWFGSLDDPDDVDWGAIASILADRDHLLNNQAWRAICSAPWFRFLDGKGRLERWLGDEETVEAVAFVLITAAGEEPARVATLLGEHLGKSKDWNRRIAEVLTRVDVDAGRPLFDLLLSLVEEGKLEGDHFWFSVHDLPKREPEWADELLAAYLKERIEAASEQGLDNPFKNGVVPGDLHIAEYVFEAAKRAPKSFVSKIWPLIVELAERNAREPYDDEHMAPDDIWVLRHFGDFAADLSDELLIGIEQGLASVAKEDPKYFRELVKEQWETKSETVAYLLYHGLAANPENLADLAIDFLLQDKARFRIAHSDGIHWGTRRLLEAITLHASPGQLARLEEAILGYTTSWERSKEGHAGRGYAEFTFLGAIPEERHSETARARFAELSRKFDREDADPPTGIIAGAVGPPISDSDAEKMSDENWLGAMRRYDSDDFRERRELLTGGAGPLSGVLERKTKEDPVRFALLAEKMRDDLNLAYFEAILRGVGDTDKDVSVEVAAKLVERCHRLPDHPCGRWIADPLVPLARNEIPKEALEIIAWYADNGDGASTVSTDDDDWKLSAERLMMRGLNSVRGNTAHDITRIVAGHPSHLLVLLPTIRNLVKDPELGVRAMAAEIPLGILHHDEELATELFLEAVGGVGQELLASRGVNEFLRHRAAHDFERLRPVIERMLDSEDQEVRRHGAVQAALAALSEDRAHALVDRCLESGAEFSLGVAQVFAANVSDARFRAYCEGHLKQLFEDSDAEVRKAAGGALRQMRDGGLEKFVELAEAFTISAALKDDPESLLMAIEGADRPPPDLALNGAKAVLSALDQPSDIRKRDAMIANEVVDVVLRAYVDADDEATKNAALHVFDSALRNDAYGARKALENFDRG